MKWGNVLIAAIFEVGWVMGPEVCPLSLNGAQLSFVAIVSFAYS